MPCYTVTTVTLRLKSDSVQMDLLADAVRQNGHRILRQDANSLEWDTGSYSRNTETIVERSMDAANAIRQSYAASLVEKNLRRFGWQIKKKEQQRG